MREMKRGRTIFAIVILAAVLGSVAWLAWSRHQRSEQSGREASYRKTLDSYKRNLPPGTPREAVERALRSQGLNFDSFIENQADLDTLLIGNEHPPWYCSRLSVYLTFEFYPKYGNSPSVSPDDPLKGISVRRRFEDCL